MLREPVLRLAKGSITREITRDARVWLIQAGQEPVFGARLLRRALEHHVASTLSTKLLVMSGWWMTPRGAHVAALRAHGV